MWRKLDEPKMLPDTREAADYQTTLPSASPEPNPLARQGTGPAGHLKELPVHA
jgi:hypothetical protein